MMKQILFHHLVSLALKSFIGEWSDCLSIYLSIYLSTYLPTYLPACLPTTYLPTCLPAYLLPTYLTTYLPTCLPAYLPAYLPTYLPTYLPAYLPTYLPTYLLPTYLSKGEGQGWSKARKGKGTGVKGWRGGGGGEVTGVQKVARGNLDLTWTHSVTSTYQPRLTPTQHPWWLTKHLFFSEAPFISDKDFMWLPLSTMG